MIARLALFGASGDLAGRYLLPALAALHAAGRLPDGFEVVGAARPLWDDEAFREHARDRLAAHAAHVPPAARDALVGALRYRPVDLADADSVVRVVRDAAGGPNPVATYLALPPKVFAATVRAIAAAGLVPGSRVAIEKPFGDDLDHARELNALLASLFGDATERIVFRVDHALGMPTVRRLLALRLGDRVLDAVWGAEHIEKIRVLWEEDLALEGRAGYFDGAGALKDVMQNHMLQVLALAAMELPRRRDGRDLRDAKAGFLHALRPPERDEMRARSRRARYAAGRVGEREIPAYVDEHGIDPARRTETFAEVVLTADTPRWHGTRFVLRAGKALGHQRKELVVRFRPTAAGASELRVGIDGPLDLSLTLRAAGGRSQAPRPVRLNGPPPDASLPAYANVLLDVLTGGTALSVRGDEAEAAWRVVTPILDAWAADVVPLEEYPAGSQGPPPTVGGAPLDR